VRALRGMKDYQKALDMLDIAEQISDVNMETTQGCRQEVIAEMKEYMLKS
jgi:hypothetical protein